MVTLPQLESYSDNEVAEFSQFSAIFLHYRKLIARPCSDPSDILRQKKYRHWLECAYATLKGDDTAEEVCQYWSDCSDKLLLDAWKLCGLDQEPTSLFAMGKLGSQELNLSSDVDLFFVRENDSDPSNINKKIKKFIQILNNKTSFGFAYRVDTSLRPGGEMSPLSPAVSHFFNYFDEYLEAWNRMSFIRLRHLYGSPLIQEKITSYCKRLAFPKRLDFSVVEEIKSIRSQLEYQWRKSSEPFDIKFHPGGIRDIELYIQSLQVIYGGRNPSIATTRMTQAMDSLLKAKILTASEVSFLKSFYWKLRQVENHVHISEDKHSYVLRKDLLKKIDHITSEKELTDGFNQVTLILNNFFNENKEQVKNDWSTYNFSKKSQKSINDILNLKSHSLKKRDTEKRKQSILNQYLVAVDKISLDSDLAIEIFRDFIFSIKSKSSIFFLLDRHPELLENLAWLFSLSPYVGQVLCRRPELVDSFVLGKVELNINDDTESLMENLVDYKFLGQIVAIIYYLKSKNIEEFTTRLSENADFIVNTLLSHLQNQFSAEPIEVLCMGKWSGFELGVQSDLDFVFLTKNRPTNEQIKIVRRFINLMTSSSQLGKLYSIDLRLKPSQSAGPLLIEENQLTKFISSQAEAWQKLAYLKSRLINKNSFFFQNKLNHLSIDKPDISEIKKILDKLLTHNNAKFIDIKTCYGGLVHTELISQQACLVKGIQTKHVSTSMLCTALLQVDPKWQEVRENYLFLRNFEQFLQICNASASTKVSLDNPHLWRIAKLLKVDEPFKRLESVTLRQQELLKSLT